MALTVKAHKGDAKTLLAFDLPEDESTRLAGFTIQVQPGSGRSYYLWNELQFEKPGDHAQVDSERCYPEDPGGVAETAARLAEAGAAGFSIEDYDPATDRIDDVGLASERVAEAAAAARSLPEPLLLTGRCENHIRGVDDLDDTIARLVAYRDAGADVVYAPGLATIEQVREVVDAVGVPVNVLALPRGPAVAELAAAGVRRVSTGGALARAAYGALLTAAQELRDPGTSTYASAAPSSGDLEAALSRALDS